MQVVLTGKMPIQIAMIQNPSAFYVSATPLLVYKRFGKKGWIK